MRSETVLRLLSVVRMPDWVAVRIEGEDLDFAEGCDSRRRPEPIFRGPDFEAGSWLLGTSSPGNRMSGVDIVVDWPPKGCDG